MSLPDVVSREGWLAARKELLAEEKAFTKQRDALNTKRRRAADGQDREGLRVRGSRRQGPPGRPVRGSPAADRRALHVRPELGRRLPELHRRRRRDRRRPARAPPHARHDARVRLPRTDREDRGLQGAAGLDVPVVLVVRLATSTTTSTSPGRVGRCRSSTTSGPRRSSSAGVRLYDTSQSAMELPGPQRIPARRRPVFHTYSVYARGLETMGGSYYLLDETALGRQEDWEEPKGRADFARGNEPNFKT